MQLHQLENLIRATGTVTDRQEFIVIGSQSILGSVERPPLECLMSNEVDRYPKDRNFNVFLLRAGLVDAPSAFLRVPDMPIDAAARSRLTALITRLAAQAAAAGPLTT